MHWLYILRNEGNGKHYVGSTNDIKRRVSEHKSKNRNTWASNQPGEWKLIYKEEFRSKSEAARREKMIKSKKSRSYIERIISENKVTNGA